jgi:hypothetical protein
MSGTRLELIKMIHLHARLAHCLQQNKLTFNTTDVSRGLKNDRNGHIDILSKNVMDIMKLCHFN